MCRAPSSVVISAVGFVVSFLLFVDGFKWRPGTIETSRSAAGALVVRRAMKDGFSPPLAWLRALHVRTPDCEGMACGTSPPASFPAVTSAQDQRPEEPIPPPAPPPALRTAEIAVEQTSQGTRPTAPLLESFDGMGAGFEGPQVATTFRNPSDNSLAVGPDHIVQIVNSRIAIFSKRGKKYDKSGTVLYGPVATKSLWTAFGGVCEARNNGDAVVRYDQVAERWLVVMPIFSPIGPDDFPRKTDLRPGEPVPQGQLAKAGEASSPGSAWPLPANPPQPPPPPERGQRPAEKKEGVWAMCYAVSTGPDPLDTYYRYAFERNLFPDYPRPAVWIDGYYLATSSGDDVIQKHVCIADRTKMIAGQPATEQCIVMEGVNFLNNADIDGRKLPPAGAPNIMMAAGGTQLKNLFDDDGIYFWKVHVDWKNPANTKATGPRKIPVAPYHYLCNGQLTSCVPQPNTERRLDVQGDKIMNRLVYRRLGGHESIVAAHSVATQGGGGGVRWYEFQLDKNRDPPGQIETERDFNEQGEETSPVQLAERYGRRGTKWFSFDLPVEAGHPMGLVVTFSNDGRRQGSFDILVEGKKLGEQATERRSPEQDVRFLDVAYAIPPELIAGKQKVTVRFETSAGGDIPGVFGIRIIRADEVD
jgi:hypothetical protein